MGWYLDGDSRTMGADSSIANTAADVIDGHGIDLARSFYSYAAHLGNPLSSGIRREVADNIFYGVGVRNQCYMAAIVMSLLHVKPLVDHVLKHRSTVNGRYRTVHNAFAQLCLAAWFDRNPNAGSLAPVVKRLRRRVAADERFATGQQEDAEEFLTALLEGLIQASDGKFDTERRTPKGQAVIAAYSTVPDKWDAYSQLHSELWRTFYRSNCRTLTCQQCKTVSAVQTEEVLTSVTVPEETTAEDFNLSHWIDNEHVEEVLDGHNARLCGHCGSKQPTGSSWERKHVPGVFVIRLRRFGHEHGHASKIETPVTYPTIPQKLEQDHQEGVYLRAVIRHRGISERSGHYTAIVWNMEKKCYYEYDDLQKDPRKISMRQMEEIATEDKEAYVFFYVRLGALDLADRTWLVEKEGNRVCRTGRWADDDDGDDDDVNDAPPWVTVFSKGPANEFSGGARKIGTSSVAGKTATTGKVLSKDSVPAMSPGTAPGSALERLPQNLADAIDATARHQKLTTQRVAAQIDHHGQIDLSGSTQHRPRIHKPVAQTPAPVQLNSARRPLHSRRFDVSSDEARATEATAEDNRQQLELSIARRGVENLRSALQISQNETALLRQASAILDSRQQQRSLYDMLELSNHLSPDDMNFVSRAQRFSSPSKTPAPLQVDSTRQTVHTSSSDELFPGWPTRYNDH
jgi:ubiquitin C-terminal hydrolase